MVRIKPAFDGSTELEPPEGFGTFYDGPPPVPGKYKGTLKKLGLAKIGSGDNKGQDRLAVLVEITQGRFKGAGVFHSLNMTQQGGYFVNEFLWSLTDGSEKQKNAIVKMFWQKGYDVADQADGKMGRPINVIGKSFVAVGRPLEFVTTMDHDLDGNERAKIVRFVIPRIGTEEELDETEDAFAGTNDSEPDLSGLDEFAPQMQAEPEPVGATQDTSGAVPLDDDDDPWS